MASTAECDLPSENMQKLDSESDYDNEEGEPYNNYEIQGETIESDYDSDEETNSEEETNSDYDSDEETNSEEETNSDYDSDEETNIDYDSEEKEDTVVDSECDNENKEEDQGEECLCGCKKDSEIKEEEEEDQGEECLCGCKKDSEIKEEEEEEEEEVKNWRLDRDSDSDYESKEEAEEYRRYRDCVEESHGFDVPRVKLSNAIGIIVPIDLIDGPDFCIKRAKKSARFAIKYYNANIRKKKEKLKLVEVVKANKSLVLYYITLKARGCKSGLINTYQAIVYYDFVQGFVQGEHQLKKFRLEPKMGNQAS